MSIEPKAYFLCGDCAVHDEPTLDTAAGFMEPIDVENGEYDAVFDDSGRRYAFSVVDGNTCLEPTNDVELDELRSRLQGLARTAFASENVDADDPFGVAVAVSRFEWEHRWPRWPRWLDRRLHGNRPRIVR